MEESFCLNRAYSSRLRRIAWGGVPTPYSHDWRQRQRDVQNPCNGCSIGEME
jgi:hypothetical protein